MYLSTNNPRLVFDNRPAVPKKCDACPNPATCVARAGLSVYFQDTSHGGKPYHDQDRLVYCCDTCCGHGDSCLPLDRNRPA